MLCCNQSIANNVNFFLQIDTGKQVQDGISNFFVLLYGRFGPIEYKGPFVAPYMESFILRVITPLTYLPSRAKLEEFLSYHEVMVVLQGTYYAKLILQTFSHAW